MAFKLDKQEIARRDEIVVNLNEAATKLEDAIAVYTDEVNKLRGPLEESIAAYNEAVTAASGFAEDIASRADDEISDKSEKWQEGERGEAATIWKDEWEGASFDEVEIEFPDDITLDELDHSATLEQLPEQAD